MVRSLLFVFTTLYCSLVSTSTYAQLDINNFLLGGNAQQLDEQCIRLVPDLQYARGSAWYKKPIDLNAPFEMQVCLVLGCKDQEGADGIVFVFHPTLATGGWGESMGFGGLVPSLGLEFDTYQNYHLYDPEEDHFAIMQNGRTHHGYSALKPIELPNLEDCRPHPLKITWSPEVQQLEIYLDETLLTTYEADLVNQIFGGNSVVYWGVTAATGRLSNDQDICIKKLLFTEAAPPLLRPNPGVIDTTTTIATIKKE